MAADQLGFRRQEFLRLIRDSIGLKGVAAATPFAWRGCLSREMIQRRLSLGVNSTERVASSIVEMTPA